MADISDGWGHIVGLQMEIDNLKAIRDVPLAYRWATLQADAVVYVDGVPAVLGTGLEDYFSYAHGFEGANNRTYAFVGVYHSSSPQVREPLTFHCYRQHIFDPVVFSRSLKFVMEGTHSSEYFLPAKTLNYTEHRTRVVTSQQSLAHTVYYYYKESLPDSPCDIVQLGDFRFGIQTQLPRALRDIKSQRRDIPIGRASICR